MHTKSCLSLLAGAAVKVVFLLSSAASAESCDSNAFLYEMIDKSGVVSDRSIAILRQNSPATRDIIGGAIPGGSTGYLRERSWIATFQFAEVYFSLSKYSNPDSNYRHDVTIFFMDGYAAYPNFDLFALSIVGGVPIEYDLLTEHDAPPAQLHLSLSNYREVYTQVLEASLAFDPSGDSLRTGQDRWTALLSVLSSASGAWKLSGCYDEKKEVL